MSCAGSSATACGANAADRRTSSRARWPGSGPDDPTVNLRPEEFRVAAARRRAAAPPEARHVSTAIFGAATGLSRVLGLVREVIASYYFGTAGKINAFTIAFQLPNLVRALVADAALSSAFVPVFVDLLKKDPKRAWRVASSLFWLMLLGLTALSALFILISPWVIGVFGNPGHDRALAVGLSRVLFPIVALLGVSGIIVGILNSYDHFTVPAISPVFWNIAIIVGLAIGVPQAHAMNTKLYVYAVSILIATFIQAFLPLPWLRGYDGRLRLALDWRDPAVKEVFKNMVPVTLGLGLINVNAVIDMFFASRYIDPNLAPTAIQKAFLIYMLPQGMFSVAIATVLFPTLSRHASEARESGDFTGFRNTVAFGLAADRVPARACGGRERRARGTDRAPPLPARTLPSQPDAGRGELPRRVQRRPRLQRRDADAQPRVLQPPFELDPDVDRARQPLAERACSTLRSTGSECGGSRSRRRSATSPATWALLVVLRRRIRRIEAARSHPRRSASPRRRRSSRSSRG